MKLLSVNTGLPRTVIWHGRDVSTSIFKLPVAGPVALQTLNLEGDRQADLSVHGGPDKAVYCYASEHYDCWKSELPGRPLPPGTFGENFTTAGLPEESVHVGDSFRIGSAELVVTQPRLPCFKLGVRFQSDDMVRRFLASGRTGFYVAVTKEGKVGEGDAIERLSSNPSEVAVSEIVRLYIAKQYNAADIQSVRKATEVPALPSSWKNYFVERLAMAAGSNNQ